MSFPDVFKALSDPVRREILTLLKQQGKMPAGEIAAEFELSNATISYHLSMLRKADLVFETIVAKAIAINEQKLKDGFKRCFGVTVNDYVVEKRLEAAIR